MKRSPIRWLSLAILGLGGLGLCAVYALACSYVYLAPSLPTAEKALPVPLRVLTRDGKLISRFSEQRRIPVRYEDIPALVREAVLSAEDDRFFEHHGFDWMGILRALVMDTVTAQAGQGGSTISQQAARNMFLSLDKTARRKLSEVFVTYRMEKDFTKEQILATYLNVVFFGQRSYGIAAAAETYYGRTLDELSVAQAATLAGIIQAPARYNPIVNAPAAEGRRSYVLRRMTHLGYISAATAAAAAREPVATHGYAPKTDVEGAYGAELVRQEIVRRYGPNAVNAGYTVYTTLDETKQTAATRALRQGLMIYDRRYGYRGRVAKLVLSADPSVEDLENGLEKFPVVGELQPAVVTSVADNSAAIYIRNQGAARISWEGLSWARRAVAGGVGAAPRKAADIVQRGDVIYISNDEHGKLQLAQVPAAQAAIVSLDPHDGAILALVGGFDFHSNEFNRVTQAHRQPGSGFKPFLYSAALENGLTAASVMLDMPIVTGGGSDAEDRYRPKNAEGGFGGPMRLREALVHSRNLVSIRVLQRVGFDKVIDYASRFGFDPNAMPRDLTLALGSQLATPLQMATAYAVFANGGFRVEPYLITRIEDATGKVVFEAQPKIACPACEPPPAQAVAAVDAPAPTSPAPAAAATGAAATTTAAAPANPTPSSSAPVPPDRRAPRVITAQNAWLMTDIMHDVAARGTGKATQELGRDDLAGKTGTTDAGTDNWFNGFNANLVATVWLGYDDMRSLGEHEEGATTAVPMWNLYMREALRGTPSARMPRPDGLVDIRISPTTGAPVSPTDPNGITEIFIADHLPEGSQAVYDTAAPSGPAASGTPAGNPARPAGSTGGTPIF